MTAREDRIRREAAAARRAAREAEARRAHREEFTFALANGLSLEEARRQRARLKWRAAEAALNAAKEGGKRGLNRVETPAKPLPWWLRD